jgi:hypothetical protein
MMRRSHLAGPGSIREVFSFDSSYVYFKRFSYAVSDLHHHSSMSEMGMFRQLSCGRPFGSGGGR